MPELSLCAEKAGPTGVHISPLCAHPALWALAGRRAYRRGLPDEDFKSGWANVQSNNYWSSSTNANNTDNAWNVNMWNGNVNNDNKTNNNYVLPVRAGEWSPPHFTFENLYRSYRKCRKNKRGTINALKFEVNAEENLFNLSAELSSRTYRPSRSVCFIVERPKMREIIAADFKDRVVHHLLVEKLETIYEPVFIYDSYACRKDKGLHKAVRRVRDFIGRCSKNGRVKPYFIHLDIKNFFMTIDKEVLYGLLRKKIKDEDLLRLAHTIILHNPSENCIINGKKQLIEHLPPHKSLFYAGENKGLPVGNLTSQFFANVYLNELDLFVKHTLKCRYYVRYCDDFLMLDESPSRLENMRERIRVFLRDKLKISLNEKFYSVMPVSNGMDFLGYIIRRDYILVRRRVVNNLKSRLDMFEKRLVTESAGLRIIRYDYDLLEKLRAVLASYFGHLKWADTYNLNTAVLEKYGFLKEYFSFESGRVKRRYKYCDIFPSVKSQYLYYANVFRGMVVFFKVGCFHEFYGEIKGEVKTVLNLKRLKENRRGTIYGFPVKLEKKFAERLIEKGMSVVIVNETEQYIGRIRERMPAMKIVKEE